MNGGRAEDADGDIRFDSRRGHWVVAATVLGSAMVMVDATVVNVALPQIAGDLGADFAVLQWVVTGYTLALASLILLGGSLGDRYGRRRVFVVGVIWFAGASALCAMAPTSGLLIAGRMLQGVGGALLTPGSLAIISAVFHPDDRGRAIGAWSGLGGIGAAVGPFLGGWLVQVSSWRLIFLLNIPLAAVVVAIARRCLPESKDLSAAPRFDVLGAVTCSVGLAVMTYGLIQRSPGVTLLGLGVLAVFVAVEVRSDHAMVPVSTFANRVFRDVNAMTFVIYAALGMVFFMLPLVLQEGLGYSPLAAGASLFPVTLLMLTLSARTGALAGRVGPRLPLSAGPVLIGTGLLLLTRVTPGRSYALGVLPALVLFGLGLALTVAPLTATVLGAVDPHHAGLASGVNNAVSRLAGLVAVASVPILAGFDPSAPVPATTLVSGFHSVVTIGAAACVFAGALGFVTLRASRLPAPTGPAREPCFECPLDGAPMTLPAARSAS